MRRDLGQMSLADGLVNQRAGRNEWLDRINRIVDWSAVASVLSPVYASDEGRPSYPVLSLVKLLSGLIRDAILTGADLHDSLAGPSLVQGDEAAVYADKVYDSRRFRNALEEAGIEDGIMRPGAIIRSRTGKNGSTRRSHPSALASSTASPP